MVGDILVVQPSFLFPPAETEQHLDTVHQLKQGDFYLVGVGLCLYVAMATALSNVINVSVMKTNESITSSHLMLMTGVFSIILSLISSLFLPNRLISDPLSLPLTSAVVLLVSAVMTFTAFWSITLAVTITKTPTLIAVLRSTEIILSLVTESLWWRRPPHYLSLTGSILVMFSVVIITSQDFLVSRLSVSREKESVGKD